MDDIASAQRLAAIVEAAVDAILTIDEYGTVESFNPAAERLFGWSAEEVIGDSIEKLMPEPDRSRHHGYVSHYVQTGEKRIIGIGRETRALRRDGTVFPIHLSVAEVAVRPKLFVGIIRDITRMKTAEAARESLIRELESKNAELERFTYTVSHDLKSPLITIKGFLGMVEKDAEVGNMDRLRKDLARIAGASDKMKQLLDDLLELSRIGRIANAPEDVDFRGLVDEVLAMLEGPILESGATVDVAPDFPAVRGDRVRLREVLQNLVENALKFSDDQPRLAIRVEPRDDVGPVFVVADEGRGIDPAYLDKVFGLFEQLNPGQAGSRWKGAPGTGIGLALVRRIVEVHGGRIWAESEGPGRGTRVCFTLAPADA